LKTPPPPHAKVEKLNLYCQLPEMVRRIDQFTATMVQPSAVPESVAVFLHRCRASSPCPLTFPSSAGAHQIAVDGISGAGRGLATLRPHPETALEPWSIWRCSNAVLSQHADREKFSSRTSKTGCLCVAGARIDRVYRGEKPEALRRTVSAQNHKHASDRLSRKNPRGEIKAWRDAKVLSNQKTILSNQGTIMKNQEGDSGQPESHREESRASSPTRASSEEPIRWMKS